MNLTQRDLAELAGVSLHTVINLESENPNPTLHLLQKVLGVLGLGLRIVSLKETVNEKASQSESILR